MVERINEERIEETLPSDAEMRGESYSSERSYAEKPRQHRGKGITGAVLLIGAGVALLLGNLGLLTVNWLAILQYWPVLLILIGVDLLFGRRSFFGNALLSAFSVAVVIGVIILASVNNPVSTNRIGVGVEQSFVQAIGSPDVLSVELNMGAGEVIVYSADGSNIEGTYETAEGIEADITYEDGAFVFSTSEGLDTVSNIGGRFLGSVEVAIPEGVPVDLVVNGGLGSIELDLSDIDLHSLTIEGGAGEVVVRLPDSGDYTVDADLGLGSVEIAIPSNMEAYLNLDTGIGDSQIDSALIRQGNGTWVTSGYDGADNRATLNIDAGAGEIVIDFD